MTLPRGITLVVALFALWTVWPMLIPLLLGAAFAALMGPVCSFVERRMRIPRHHASWITLLASTVVIVLPLVLIALSGARSVLTIFGQWKANTDSGLETPLDQLRHSPMAARILEFVNRWVDIDASALADSAVSLGKKVGLVIANHAADGLAQLPSLMIAGVILLFSSYVFLVDGKLVKIWWHRYSPFNMLQTELLGHGFVSICRSVLLATVVSGLGQALIFCLGYVFVGGVNTAVIGFLIFIFSLIPILGSMPVTITVSLYHWFVMGQTGVGIALLVLAIIVGLIDNLIKPWVMKGAGNLHPLLTFVAIFGGLQVLGPTGLFVGPIVIAFAIQLTQVMLDDRASSSS